MPTKTNGCLKNVENASDKTVPIEKTEYTGALYPPPEDEDWAAD